MTYRRSANTVEAVLTDVIKSCSDAELAKGVGKSRAYLQRCANPFDRRSLSLQDAVKLDRLLAFRGEPPRFLPLFDRMLWSADVQSAAGQARVEDVTARLLLALGELHAAVGQLSGLVGAVAQASAPSAQAADPSRRRQSKAFVELVQESAGAVGDALKRVSSLGERRRSG